MKHGEIRCYKFIRPERPVLILTRNSVLEYLGEVTVAPITSTVRSIPSEVFLSREDGMSKVCAINCDHLQTVSKKKNRGLITTLSPVKMVNVGKAIRFALDI
jgi:mRNA interferase MazF